MSLKFGVYLVEQRIVTPEQFCGLVKIQQESAKSAATIALRKNLLTIKQVATVLDIHETTPGKSFVQIALEADYLDRADANELVHQQQLSCPSIRKLIVECGILTQRQAAVLFQHFERAEHKSKVRPQAAPQAPVAPQAPAIEEAPATSSKIAPRQPKFKQRPVVVHQYTK